MEIEHNGINGLRNGLGSESIRSRFHIVVLNEEGAFVAGRLKLNTTFDAGESKPP